MKVRGSLGAIQMRNCSKVPLSTRPRSVRSKSWCLTRMFLMSYSARWTHSQFLLMKFNTMMKMINLSDNRPSLMSWLVRCPTSHEVSNSSCTILSRGTEEAPRRSMTSIMTTSREESYHSRITIGWWGRGTTKPYRRSAICHSSAALSMTFSSIIIKTTKTSNSNSSKN